ncbi:MAG: carboxypeptidase-like regulatory domain-containing protein [Bacteroidales bacterium]|nr:carboxypeptidase-like regulatory domain-containing protein [Bacteroidales bacterium]
MKYHKLILILLCFWPYFTQSQQVNPHNDDYNLVQFSGITITVDSLNPVPYTRIFDKTSRRGTTSDISGYFSFVAHKKDTIIFTALGFKPSSFIIPDTITKQRYSLIQLMTSDTLTLAAAYIFPWPTLEDFKRAFIETKIPDDDIEIARKNLLAADIRMRAENYPMDAQMNYNNFIDNQTSKLYYFGQQQPFQIFNPFAWAQFIKAWKEGKFKSQQERLK